MRVEGTDVWRKGEEVLEGGVKGDKKLNQSRREREKRYIVGEVFLLSPKKHTLKS